jgi:hypothetical protein
MRYAGELTQDYKRAEAFFLQATTTEEKIATIEPTRMAYFAAAT